jgi:hypothetical protein
MAKRKYQLPHYDRVHPMIRNALNIGVLKSEVEMAFVDREPESVRLFFNNGGCGECFGVGSDMAASIRVHWDSEYETHGDRIGRIYRQVWEDFMDLEMLNPGIALEQEATNFAYAEATAAHEYDRYGRQAFSIMPMMAEMFENTDLGDLTLDDLHMPFDCFYVSLEESKVTFLDGFYVHRRQDVGGDVLAFVGFGFQCDADHVNETWPDDYTPRTEKEAADRDGYFRYHFEIQLNRTSGSVHDKPWSRTHLWGGVPLEQVIDRIHDHPDLKHGLDTARGFAGLGMTDGNREVYKQAVDSGMWPLDKMSRYMVRMAMSLILYLNSDNRSVVVTSEREEAEGAGRDVKSLKGARRGRRRKKLREASERRKYMSTANVTRVGGKETAAITGRPGFSFDQPRHWRKGHFHHYWTGPKKIDGVEIPFDEWEDKRTSRRPWVFPILINPDAELELVTCRTVVHHEDEFKWMDDIISTQKTEGERKEVSQSKIERDPRNRRLCIEAHGEHCFICGKDGGWMDDDMRLNSKGLPSAWLHCHHIEPLGESAPRNTDPEKDMVPMCAECHTMMHLRSTALTLEEGMMFHRKRMEYEKRRKASSG